MPGSLYQELIGKQISAMRRIIAQRMQRRIPELIQMEATECGALCLTMILNYYGRKISIAEVREHCGVGRDGLSALAIVKGARDYGFRVRTISLPKNDFRFVALPAIIHWEFSHFVVVERWTPKYVDIVDPALGRRRVTAEEFDGSFTGIVIMLEPSVQFSRSSAPPQLSLWAYCRYAFCLPGFIAQTIVVSLLLQLLGLGVPLLTKIVIDQIIPAGMLNLMTIIGLGALVLVISQFAMMLLRAALLIYIQAKVDTQMMLGFFEHLLTLPYRFFQHRSSGDLLARLNSNIAIRDTMTNQMISTLLDGSTVIIYLFILLGQSWILTILVLALGLFQVGSLLLTNRAIHTLTQQDLLAQGKAQGYMAEALTGIATIKAAGAEHRVFHRWSNLFFDHLNVSVRRDYLSSVLNTAMGTLTMMAPLLLLWVGTLQVLHGAMSVGTMLALNALALAFLTPLSSLASSGQKLQLVRAHFERIADVVGAEPEQDVQTIQQPPILKGQVELKHVSFRYDPNAPLVLCDINISIEPGQKVALVGRTGSGKSTLGKLLLGLYIPTEGQILYDDIPLQSLNYQAVRSQFGVVLQESMLFNCSIRENIALSNPTMNVEQVVQAAGFAAIHDEIVQMPMGYETLVAEGGSAISGGQRQRLSIARALAANPAILLLDEASSHLDVLTEQLIDQRLNGLTCTRIVVAHRLSTIRNADLILVLDEGCIVERGTHHELLEQNGYYAKLIQSQMEQKKQKSTTIA